VTAAGGGAAGRGAGAGGGASGSGGGASGEYGAGESGHEARDVRLRPVVVAGAGLVALVALVAALMPLLVGYLSARESRRGAPASPLAGVYGRQAPPEPRLQTAPLDDLRTLRAVEDAALSSYGWVDREAGVARIPIERAMELLAARGLPARPEGGEGAP
jgi:hypothetical protein